MVVTVFDGYCLAVVFVDSIIALVLFRTAFVTFMIFVRVGIGLVIIDFIIWVVVIIVRFS